MFVKLVLFLSKISSYVFLSKQECESAKETAKHLHKSMRVSNRGALSKSVEHAKEGLK
jgi:hypothetical protein